MQIQIPAVLSKDQVALARKLINESQFQDGKLTAGKTAQFVKNNEELSSQSPHIQTLNNLVMMPLVKNPQFQSAALPQRIATPFYARYTAGKEYGYHVDDPIMGQNPKYRTDVSFTIFLSEPDEYEGGELDIKSEYDHNLFKLPAGDVIVYPSSSLHRVCPVTSGQRVVALSWIQSLIRDAAKREILFNMNLAKEKLQAQPDNEEGLKLDIAYANLFRMWAEP